MSKSLKECGIDELIAWSVWDN